MRPRTSSPTVMRAYVANLARWRAPIVLATLALAAVALLGALALRFTTDYRVFFRADDPTLASFEAMRDTYTREDNVLFVLAPADGDVFTRSFLGAYAELTRDAWQLPHSVRVDSLTNFQSTRGEGDDLVVEDLVADPGALDAEELERVRRTALSEPLLVGRLVSPAGHVAAVNVTFELPDRTRDTATPRVARTARGLAQRLRRSRPEIEVYVTGLVAMNHALTEVPVSDLMTLMPLAVAVICVLLGLLLRNPWATLVTLLVVLLAVGTAMGAAGWLGVRLTPPSAAAPIVILTLALADCVHLQISYLHALRRGLAREDALAESLQVNVAPITLTSVTTILGFLGLNLSASPPFQHLGNLVAAGIAAAMFLALVFLPALLTMLPAHPVRRPIAGTGLMATIARLVTRHRRPLLWSGPCLIVFVAVTLPRNELNDAFVEYFAERVEFRRATDFTHDNLTGLYVLHYSLEAGAPGAVVDPRFMATVDAFAGWLRDRPEVMHVRAIPDVVKRLNRNLHADDDGYYRVPRERQLSAQVLLLYELSLPYGKDLDEMLDAQRSATRVSAALRPLSSRDMLTLEAQASAWLAAHAPQTHAIATGSPLMFAYIGMSNIRSMLLGALLVLVAISVLLGLAFRSARWALVSLVPNLAPAALAFGVWGLVVGEVGMALSAVACMTLGIVVDDTVHFMSKYLHARREHRATAEAAVRYAFETVGPAMLITSLVLTAGFSILLLSSFVPNAAMGLLTIITLTLALVADLLLLPALLLTIDRDSLPGLESGAGSARRHTMRAPSARP